MAEIHERTLFSPRLLLSKKLHRGRRGLHIGHIHPRRHSAGRSRPGCREEIFLMRITGVTGMRVKIDDSRDNDLSRHIYNAPGAVTLSPAGKQGDAFSPDI